MDNITLVCHESFDGIMTAVYDGWVYMNRGYNVSIHPGGKLRTYIFLSICAC